jgi:hypothetical protein
MVSKPRRTFHIMIRELTLAVAAALAFSAIGSAQNNVPAPAGAAAKPSVTAPQGSPKAKKHVHHKPLHKMAKKAGHKKMRKMGKKHVKKAVAPAPATPATGVGH